MAKKKSGNLGLILTVAVLVLGVAAFCMAFLVGVKYVTSKGTVTNDFTGFQTMFGYTETTEGIVSISTKVLKFSILATLAFVLPLIGAVVSLLKNNVAKLVGALLMIGGAVLMFLLPSFVVFATAEAGELLLAATTAKLGVGAIIGGICAALGGLVAGYSALRK